MLTGFESVANEWEAIQKLEMIQHYEQLAQQREKNSEAKRRLKEELDKQAAEFSERKRRGKSEMKEFA